MVIHRNNKFINLLQSNKKFLLFILLMSVFRSAVADWYSVPTGSMQPTIQEGDRIVVNKMAYDIRLPFTDTNLINIDTPKRGEIVVFESKAAQKRLIKRVVGLPGDIVAMNNEVIMINGQELPYTSHNKTLHSQYSATSEIETLGNVSHLVNIDNTASNELSSFSSVKVPTGHYLVLGDNRRHSADSRVYGFVPHNELRGKATAIAFSVNYENFYLPRSNRVFKDIYSL